MATDWTRIGAKARREPKLVFTSLYHHIYDEDNLRVCYDTLEASKATGVDGVTKAEYGKELEANLRDLSGRLKRMGYRPGPKRRSYIPKAGSEKGRALGISNLEDKIVEMVTKRTLEPIYEAVFEDSSYGYRPQSSPHKCVDELGRTIQQQKVSQVVEADIRSFFDKVNHEWMIKFLRHRIGDERGEQADRTDAQKRHHGRGTGPCHRGRYSPRVDTLAAAVEHLPALRAGPMVQPAGAQAESRRSILLPLRGRLSGLFSVQG